VSSYHGYGRVCCFKGFDADSFTFNTRAAPELFDRQFELMRRLLALGIDLYAYATFTAPTPHGIDDGMKRFVDHLQDLDANLPLRTVPLEIQVFTPVHRRMNPAKEASLRNQQIAVEAWQRELEARYSVDQRSCDIADIRLHSRAWSLGG
jgi:hypothetical protein